MLEIQELTWSYKTKAQSVKAKEEQSAQEQEKKLLFLSDLHIICEPEDMDMESEDATPFLVEKESKEALESRQDIVDYVRNRSIYFEKDGIHNTRAQFEEFIAYIKENAFDMVIFGGDVIDCPSAENLCYLEQQLRELRIPYLVTSGNHDWNYSWEYLSDKSRAEHQPLLQAAVGQALDGYRLERYGIQFLIVDSSDNKISGTALQALLECEKTQPICVIMHVPYTTETLRQLSLQKWGFETTMGGKGVAMNETTSVFLAQLKQFENVLLLCGHVHEFADEMLCDKVRQVVAPAGCEGKGVVLHLKG